MQRVPVGSTTKFFPSSSDLLRKYGETCEVFVLRELGDEERDLQEVGRMFHVRLPDGEETDAFEDELVEKKWSVGDNVPKERWRQW